jgi:acyl-CoA dehydrogenase
MSELRSMLEAMVARLMADRVTKDVIEATEAGEWPASLWQAVEENGLTRPHLAEAAGGAGGGWLEAFVIAWASGRHSTPLPLTETMLAAWLLERAGIAVPEGPLTVLPEPITATALAEDKLDATIGDVPWARHARAFVFTGIEKGAVRVGLLPRGADVHIAAQEENIAREPRDTIRCQRSAVAELSAADVPADAVFLFGAMLRSAQMAGALQSLLDQSVAYANERVQFGRPIGKLQIIQQQLAVLAGHVAACTTAAEAAFATAARGADPRFDVAVAKVRCGDCVDTATGIAHQVHGAIGFTYEHSLHFSTRRLWSWRSEFGSDSTWAEELGRAVLERGGAALWPDLTDRR